MAQAISSRNPTAPISSHIAGRTPPRISSSSDTANAENFIGTRISALLGQPRARWLAALRWPSPRFGRAPASPRRNSHGCRTEAGRSHCNRPPQLRRLRGVVGEVRRQAEAFGHHADHFDGHVVDHHRAADHRRVAAVARLPQRIAEHRHLRAVGPVLLGGDRPGPSIGRVPSTSNSVGGDEADADADRLAVAGQVLLAGVPAADAGHRLRHVAEVDRPPGSTTRSCRSRSSA